MFNYGAINKTPTVEQVKSIIDYIIVEDKMKHLFKMMMGMKRPKPNIILLDLNDAGRGITFEIVFDVNGKIESFKNTGSWMS
jgi:hypothetical protein